MKNEKGKSQDFPFFVETEGRMTMEKRVAILAILAECRDSADKINELLHDYGTEIIGRMGLPYREKQLNIISIVMDAPADSINALAGKLGRLPGVTAKAVYAGKKD